MSKPLQVEYRVKVVTRYIVTRFYRNERDGGVEQRGEYHNADMAYEVAYALAKKEHGDLGWPPGDLRMRYPERPLPLEVGDVRVSQDGAL